MLLNGWIRYFDRTYQQIKQRALTDLGALVPEITDHTDSNPWVKMLSIFGGLIEMLGYYVDNMAREAHLATVQLYWSAIKIARSFDYRVHANLAATADVTFKLDNPATAPVVIPVGTLVTTEDGIKVYTVVSGTIDRGEEEITLGVSQYETVTGYAAGMSTGLADQVVLLPTDLVDGSAQVKVGVVVWTPNFTLGYSIGTDKDYVQSVNESKVPYIQFGDGVNGQIPTGGDSITVEYKKTLGLAGNVGALTINTIVDTIVVPSPLQISCFNRQRAVGGQGVETLAQLKSRIPKSIRTLRRAVTPKDFEHIAEMYSGVAKAGVDYNCGKFVDVYISPVGGGIASSVLIADVLAWFDDKKIITTKVNVDAAGEVHMIYVIDLQVKSGYSRAATKALVSQNSLAFHAVAKQAVKGSVQLSDIYEVIEGTTGVDYSNIAVMRPEPYARPINPTVNVLNWTRTLKQSSTTAIKWAISFTSPTDYDVVRDGVYVASFAVGTLVASLAEVEFTVTAGTYAANDNYEFWTYPYYGTLKLEEPSIPISAIGDITINANGGV